MSDLIERAEQLIANDCLPLTGELTSQLVDRIRELEAHLKEADELLEVAYYAHQKLGYEGEGNRGHSHEVRMFAMHFSQPEIPKSPKHVILSGDGRYWRFRLRDKPAKPSVKEVA